MPAQERVKIWTKRGLARLGVDVRRVQPHAQPDRATQKAALIRLRELGLEPGTVIDVGAADGTPPLHEVFPDARHVLIEPLEEFRPQLEELARRLKKADVVMAAAGAESGSVTLNVHADLVGSSLLGESEGAAVNGVERVVAQVAVDDVVSRLGADGPYVLKIDTQGSELTVLDGAQNAVLPQADVVLLEVSLFRFFDGGPEFRDVVMALHKFGFSLYDIIEHRYRPLDGALAQVDLIFVATEGTFRRHHVYATEAQRRDQTRRILKHIGRSG